MELYDVSFIDHFVLKPEPFTENMPGEEGVKLNAHGMPKKPIGLY